LGFWLKSFQIVSAEILFVLIAECVVPFVDESWEAGCNVGLIGFVWLLVHPWSIVLNKVVHTGVICSQKWDHSSGAVSDLGAVAARLFKYVHHDAVPVDSFVL